MKYVATATEDAPAETSVRRRALTAVREAAPGRSHPGLPSSPNRAATHESTGRRRVARALLEHGPATVSALATRLGVTPTAVRRQLDALLSEGVVRAQPPRVVGARSRGRPPKVFALTDTGRDAFEAAYDDLAASALRFLADNGGEQLVTQFARQRVAELESRYRTLVESSSDPAGALAQALTADGYAASTHPMPSGGAQLCQHHCPVAHVAEQFPQLCEAEAEVFGRLLGTHVQRLATIAHGDGICTTHLPAPLAARPAPKSGRTSS